MIHFNSTVNRGEADLHLLHVHDSHKATCYSLRINVAPLRDVTSGRHIFRLRHIIGSRYAMLTLLNNTPLSYEFLLSTTTDYSANTGTNTTTNTPRDVLQQTHHLMLPTNAPPL